MIRISAREMMLAIVISLSSLVVHADDIEIHEWTSSGIADLHEDLILVHNDGETGHMTVENFLLAYEKSILPDIAFERKDISTTTTIPTCTDYPLTDLRLTAPSDGTYMFHAIIELEPSVEYFKYWVGVKRVSNGRFYAFEQRNESPRQREIPPDHTSDTPVPPTDEILRITNLTGSVDLLEGQQLDVIIRQESDISLDLVIDDCSPSFYMRRIKE